MSNNITYKSFKTLLDSNTSGLTESEINQAFVFRRINIFSGLYSHLPRVVKGLQNVATVENLSGPNLEHPNLSIATLLSKPEVTVDKDTGTITEDFLRNQIYSRVAWPVSSKNNWSKLSNNFNIYKMLYVGEEKDKPYYVKFPKSVKDNNLNTIISFKSIDIDFEGTYIDTARSDVVVKVRFTLDNFSLLENYYNSDGKLITEEEPITFTLADFFTENVRFLDLLTPPEIQKEQGFINKGIVLEIYSNNTNEPKSHVELSEDRLNQISYNNALQLKLYIVDHSMSFDEITNKVDIEIEYRAAADIPLIDKNPQNNILYKERSNILLADLVRERKILLNNNCYDLAKELSDRISKIKKISFKDRVDALEKTEKAILQSYIYSPDGSIPQYFFSVRRYEYLNNDEFLDDADDKYPDDDPNFANKKALKTYAGNLYIPSVEEYDYKVATNLKDSGYPEDHRSDYFLSLHSLLCLFFPKDSDGQFLRNQVVLPYIPLAGVNGSANYFSLGDLPINAKSFDDWFHKKYINSNIYYVEYKTLVKDIILNYVNPHLRHAWNDLPNKPQVSVSIKEMIGENKFSDEYKFGNDYTGVNIHRARFIPSKNLIKDKTEPWIMIIVNADAGGDFVPRNETGGDIVTQLEDISKNYIVIEAKSPYGPFKNLKLSKNDSGYLREIRSIQQEISDIGQLGAVYDTTLETYPNCPDFRFFPGEMCYLYIPEFGLSTNENNLAYKLGIGGNQIITKESHKIELEGTTKMTTSIVMRYWSSGTSNDHTNRINSKECGAGIVRDRTGFLPSLSAPRRGPDGKIIDPYDEDPGFIISTDPE